MKTAFVFPGQGSQSVGMVSELAEKFPVIKQSFLQAGEVLDYDLWRLVCEGPEEELNKTELTQPALLTAGYAIWQVWLQAGGAKPSILAGHSLGEYTALVCADAMSFDDAVALVAQRGRLMQQAVPLGEGAMAAIIGLTDELIQTVCEQAAQEQVLSPVNFNSPGQVVIAGNTAAVNRGVEAAKKAGAKIAKILPVSVPSHCQLMKPAAEALEKSLQTISIKTPEIPVINNVDVAIAYDADDIRQALARQLYNPVRWVDTIEAMASAGVSDIVECGPGRVLMSLNKRIVKDINHHSIFSLASLDECLMALSKED